MIPANTQARRGFTLVEILIVVVILGILAAIVIPQFTGATTDATINNLRTQLLDVRTQIEIFKCHHADMPPQLVGMWTLLTSTSDTTETNIANPTGTRWGPYLLHAPRNPVNGLTGVSGNANDATAGWFYQPAGIGFTFFARNADGTVNYSY